MSEHDPDAATPEPGKPEPGRSLFDPVPVTAATANAPVLVRRRGGTPLLVTLLLTAALAGAGYWGWTHPPAGLHEAGGADSQPLAALSGRVDALEKRFGAAVGDATAGLAKKLDDVSARVDGLAAKQGQIQADAAKAVEIATQRPNPAEAQAAAPPDHTAQEVPGLVAQQEAVDKTKVGQADGGAAPAGFKSALEGIDQRLAKLEAASGTAQAQGDAGAAPAGALAALDGRVAKLEQAGAAPATDAAPAAALTALDGRVGRLEQAGQGGATAQAADAGALAALGDRLAKLEQAAGQTAAQTDAAQKARQGDTATLASLGERLGRLEQASGQVQSADEAAQKAQAADTQTLASLDARVGRLEQGEGAAQGAVSGAARDATRAIRLEAAAAALQAGEPLGELPDAPPALARYATVAPPTEAALRAEFPRVAEAARAASQPDVARRSFLDRALARLQQSVVVRQGDHVVVGDPAAGVLARAQASVAAGDLKTAADTLGALTGAAADAVRPWVAQARGLVDARAALATMAAHG